MSAPDCATIMASTLAVFRRQDRDAQAEALLSDLAARGLLHCVCKDRDANDCVCGARHFEVQS